MRVIQLLGVIPADETRSIQPEKLSDGVFSFTDCSDECEFPVTANWTLSQQTAVFMYSSSCLSRDRVRTPAGRRLFSGRAVSLVEAGQDIPLQNWPSCYRATSCK